MSQYELGGHLLQFVEDEMKDEETTSIYDLDFFRAESPPCVARSTPQLLEDARVGLGLFLEESQAALERTDLTVEQRVHIATIVSYVDGLATRFDRIRSWGTPPKKTG